MGDRELLLWVSDRLHDVLGFSESSTAQFVVALARRASKSGKGPGALLGGLADVEVPTNATSRAFAAELMARCVMLIYGVWSRSMVVSAGFTAGWRQ